MDRNDDGGGERSEVKILIFAYPADEFGHEIYQILTNTEIRQIEIYVLLNC